MSGRWRPERVLGPEHPHTLRSVNNLAALLERKGDYAGAQPLYERALEAGAGVGPEHPDTLMSVNNLADCCKSKGDYAGRSRCMSGRWRPASGCWDR
jgi:hypothetical protein